MPDTPSPHELARDQVQIERRLDREYEQINKRMDDGFGRVDLALGRIEKAISSQQSVSYDRWNDDRKRQDDNISTLADEVSKSRSQFVAGLLIVLVVAVVASLVA